MTVIPNPPQVGDEFTNDATGISYRYDGFKWVVISTPESEDVEELTQRVAEGETVQEQIQNTISDALTTQQIIQTEQGVQNNQINALETQIQLLAKATGGVWKYQRNIVNGGVRPPNGSRFYGTHIDDTATVLTDWSDIRLLMINKKDTNGTDFIFTNFEVGDKIEIIATDASSLCIGTIEVAATQESYGNMVISPDRTKGGPEEDKEYLISVYRPGEEGSGLDLDVLDGRYIQNSGENNVTTPWRIKSPNKSFISITTNEMKLYHVADPTGQDDAWAANKGYVDTEVGKVDTKIDAAIEPLASKDYVDDKIPPIYGSPYKYRNTDTTAENLQPGEFFIAGDRSNAYFHPFDQKGRELVTTADQSHATDVAGIFKVYDSTGKLVHQMAFNAYATGKGTNNYCRLDRNHTMRTKSTWSSTETYYLSDGFLLPY